MRKHLHLDGTSSMVTAYCADTTLDETGSQRGLFAAAGGDMTDQGEVALTTATPSPSA